ncbi:YbbR-like domain-containing protein [Treponema socranskii]|uniref:CdaR family protein n=1 Tax=Treponema socranskii TaxID=53419 RepID=UPI00360AF6A9
MKIKRLFEKIMENWPAKVICFGIALVLYLVHITSLLDRKTYTVPLKIVADGGMYPMSDYPEYVRITVRSTAENIAETLQSDFTATIDLTKYEKEGSFSIPVSVHLSPKLLLMDPFEIKLNPESVSMRLEEKTLKYVSVTPALSGEVQHGYTVTKTTVEPATVEITGPRRSVDETKQVYTSAIDVTSLSESKTVEASLQNINSLLAINPAKSYTVRIEVAEEPLVKKFTDVPVRLLFLPEWFEAEGEAPKISFDVAGTVPMLEDYDLSEGAVYADCSAIDKAGTYDLPVHITLPSYFQIENQSAETVSVSVRARREDNADLGAENR